jgi:hypothetical protein
MKRFFIMLLIACSAIATTNAQSKNSNQKGKPTHVIAVLNELIDDHGLKQGNSYSVKRDPNTNIIESSERIVSFNIDSYLTYFMEEVEEAFTADEPLSYSFVHVTPPSSRYYYIETANRNGEGMPGISVRNNNSQEMWLMCIKNTENPSLRDVYAIVWEKSANGKLYTGRIFMITSKRPDLYKPANEVERIGNFDLGIIDVDSVEIARKAEQARKVFKVRPDTVVIDDLVPDTIPYETIDEVHIITPPEDNSNRWNVTPLPYTPNDRQRINVKTTPQWKQEIEWRLQAKVFFIKNDIDFIKATYESIRANYRSRLNISSGYKRLLKQNKELDKKYQDFIKSLNKIQNIPENERNNLQADLYKEILKFYTEQNQAFTDMNRELGTLPKLGQKTQKYLIELTEKYMNEIRKLTSKYK